MLRALRRISYLSYPLFILSILFLALSFLGETTDDRQGRLGIGLLWLGFAFGFQSLGCETPLASGNTGERKVPNLFLVRSVLYLGLFAVLLAGVIFLVKQGGLQNPIGLGLCSAGLGLLSKGRDMLRLREGETEKK